VAEIAVLGTVAADIVLRVASLPLPGDHVRAEPLGWRLGGSSANVAVALAAAGHEVELIGVIGTDSLADALLSELQQYGVSTTRCVRVEGRSPRALILLDAAGERTILGLDAGSVTDALPMAGPPNVGSAACIYVESYRRYPTSIAGGPAGGLLVVATPPPSDAEHWPADIIVGSERQFPPDWTEDPLGRGRAIAGSRLTAVVVTRGADGADAFTDDGRIHTPARPARQVDATGAGDAFAAGLIATLLAGGSLEAAMEVAAEDGAAAVEVLRSVPPEWIDGARME